MNKKCLFLIACFLGVSCLHADLLKDLKRQGEIAREFADKEKAKTRKLLLKSGLFELDSEDKPNIAMPIMTIQAVLDIEKERLHKFKVDRIAQELSRRMDELNAVWAKMSDENEKQGIKAAKEGIAKRHPKLKDLIMTCGSKAHNIVLWHAFENERKSWEALKGILEGLMEWSKRAKGVESGREALDPTKAPTDEALKQIEKSSGVLKREIDEKIEEIKREGKDLKTPEEQVDWFSSLGTLLGFLFGEAEKAHEAAEEKMGISSEKWSSTLGDKRNLSKMFRHEHLKRRNSYREKILSLFEALFEAFRYIKPDDNGTSKLYKKWFDLRISEDVLKQAKVAKKKAKEKPLLVKQEKYDEMLMETQKLLIEIDSSLKRITNEEEKKKLVMRFNHLNVRLSYIILQEDVTEEDFKKSEALYKEFSDLKKEVEKPKVPEEKPKEKPLTIKYKTMENKLEATWCLHIFYLLQDMKKIDEEEHKKQEEKVGIIKNRIKDFLRKFYDSSKEGAEEPETVTLKPEDVEMFETLRDEYSAFKYELLEEAIKLKKKQEGDLKVDFGKLEAAPKKPFVSGIADYQKGYKMLPDPAEDSPLWTRNRDLFRFFVFFDEKRKVLREEIFTYLDMRQKALAWPRYALERDIKALNKLYKDHFYFERKVHSAFLNALSDRKKWAAKAKEGGYLFSKDGHGYQEVIKEIREYAKKFSDWLRTATLDDAKRKSLQEQYAEYDSVLRKHPKKVEGLTQDEAKELYNLYKGLSDLVINAEAGEY